MCEESLHETRVAEHVHPEMFALWKSFKRPQLWEMGFGARESSNSPIDSQLHVCIPKIRDERKVRVVDGESEVDYGHCPINQGSQSSIFVLLSNIKKSNPYMSVPTYFIKENNAQLDPCSWYREPETHDYLLKSPVIREIAIIEKNLGWNGSEKTRYVD